MAYNYYCYITASLTKVIYTGVTNNLELRVQQHRSKTVSGFTSRYGVDRLVWFEHTLDVNATIAAGEADQGLETCEENRLDRSHKSRMG